MEENTPRRPGRRPYRYQKDGAGRQEAYDPARHQPPAPVAAKPAPRQSMQRALPQTPPPQAKPEQKAEVSRQQITPGRLRGRRRASRVILSISLVLLALFVVICSVGYFLTQQGLGNFYRPLQGSQTSIQGRSWNLLLLGSDNDGKYNFPALLTQVMMVVRVDTGNNTVTMVSIPRDSWVNVPEIGGMHKIDQAFFLGATKNNTFENGVKIAKETMEKDYGITIDRYAWVGLGGFAKVIDTLGGVDIDVAHPIVDDIYPNDTGKHAAANDPYAYRRLYIAPGPQHLNGEEALEYVRSRHADLVGDIGRTQRQQQILEALKKKLNANSLFNNFQQILNDLKGQVYTDLSQDEMLGFANFGRSLQGNAIQRITLGPGQGSQDFGSYSSVYDPLVGSQQDVITPNCNTIQPVINRIFDLGIAQSCNVNGS